ncbi:glycerophosphodiester phosphodiesterase [Bifidobacterium margollesii]|uniref:Glycerophosphodiester phosphodiesterase n=1 Tax=Bifidobacterium margollesii TaxID=2020964 RepID=A0A2N5J7K1_9BIFI|nr:glycerophosphodiester phosphodiesterase family protein [Bifidobacterium margollesii]PLS30185.1 glycerophosphodiester phosphodiesterase [Bifidobacterium margollesii]
MSRKSAKALRSHRALGSGFGKTIRNTAITGGIAAGLGAWAIAPRTLIDARRNHVPQIPRVFYAHRGLHDAGSGLSVGTVSERCAYVDYARECAIRAGYGSKDFEGPVAPENSLASFAAACEAGYGIELDLQLTRDGRVVVVHDSDLKRVAGDPRRIKDLTYDELTRIPLFPAPAKSGDFKAELSSDHQWDVAPEGYYQHVPLFEDVLKVVAGRVPLIVEYKFDGYGWSDADDELMEKGDELLRAYDGAYVIESFHPGAVHWYKEHRPEVNRGQLAEAGEFSLSDGKWKDWLCGLLIFNWLGRPDFVAYDWHGGDQAQVRLARKMGAATVSWTVRSSGELYRCEPYFDRHIFEAFIPDASAGTVE